MRCLEVWATQKAMSDPLLTKAIRNLDDFSGMASDWFWETDSEHRFCYFSRRMEEATKFNTRKLLGQKRDAIPSEDLTDPKWVKHMDDLMNHRPFRDFEYQMSRPHDGTLLWIRIAGEPQFDAQGEFTGYRGTGHDVTEEKLSIQRLEASNKALADRNIELDLARKTIERSANEDPLTGLFNRRAFERDLDFAVEQPGKTIGLLHIDLDRFKWVNDSLGHPAGDKVLQEAARRLTQTVEDHGIAYRVGGDEFVIILRHPVTTDFATWLAERIISAMAIPVSFGTQSATVGVSVGLAVAKTDVTDARGLISNADVALYEAKRNGRNTVRLTTVELQRRIEDERRIAADVPGGLKRLEFIPYFQPQFDVRTGEIVGAEALARWQHPTRGLLAPAAFLRIATEVGLVDQIDRLILKESLATVDRLKGLGIALPSLSVNVSEARLVDRQLCDDIEQLWQDKGCRLAIELLETIYFDDVGSSERFEDSLQRLRKMGVRIETDDFGSGRASITGLLKIAPDRIKIDHSLVQEVVSSSKQRSLVRAILDMARSLDIDCIAEGVETSAGIKAITELGCNLFQGFAICPPLNEADFADYLRTQKIAPPDGPATKGAC